MPKISLIAAVDRRGGIGFQNRLLCHLPADLSHFKNLTLGKPIIMGYKTFLSIGRPLPNRINIVLSTKVENIPDVVIARSLAEAIAAANDADELMIIGGASIYEQSIGIADRIYLTEIQTTFEADSFFPPIDSNEWHRYQTGEKKRDEKNAYDLSFYTLERMPKNKKIKK